MDDAQKRRMLVNAAFCALVAGGVWLGCRLLPLALPFLIGLVPALVTRLVCVALFLAVVLLALTFLAAALAEGLAGLLRAVPDLLSGLPDAVKNVYDRVIALSRSVSPEFALRVADAAATLTEDASLPSEWLTALLSRLYGLLTAVPTVLVTLGVTAVSSFLFAADLPAVDRLAARATGKNKVGQTVSSLLRSGGRVLLAYGKLLALTFIELLAGFWLLKVDYAFTLALLVAFVDLLPVLGVGTVLLPWAAVAFLLGDPARGFGLLALYGIITAVRSWLEPKLVGDELGLPAFVTLPCVFLGLRLGGLAGMFLLPALVTAAVRLRDDASEDKPA